MSQLYIANASKQNVVFCYRVPETTGVRTQNIPVGKQTQITGDLSAAVIDEIISQHRKYGLVDASEIRGATAGFTGLCYSVDKPVSVDKMHFAIEKNTEILVERGKEIRKEAAISVSNGIEQQLEESGSNSTLGKLEMSVIEQDSAGQRDGASFSEALRVSRDDEQQPAPRGRGRGRRAA